jgi:probable rRNA maturation factor
MAAATPTAGDHDAADSSRQAPGPAAAVDLDLAFSATEALQPELVAAAGPWADPLAGAELWHGLLSDWLGQLAAELPTELQAPAYSLGLSLVDDAEIAQLNGDWRAKAGPTDVLAFAAQDDDLDGAPPLPMPNWATDDDTEGNDTEGDGDEDWDASGEPLELGDIVISVDTANRQAPEHGHSLERELLFLASHGLLHLLGWDHPDDASLASMLARQSELLARCDPH